MADLIAPKTGKTIKVLHVDDDSSLREISKAILLDIDQNLEIEQTNGAQEGHQKLETAKYDVVVSDYEMPQKDGLQFLKELRENKNNIPFILFTGKGREEIAIQALNLGAQGYHNKQGSPETVYGELAHSIRLCVEHNEDKQNLIKSETKYKFLTDSLPEVVFETDTNGKVTYANKSAFTIFGYTQEDFAKGIIAFNLIQEKDQTKAKENFRKAMSNENSDDNEYLCVRKDGSTFPSMILANAIIAENKSVGLRGLVIDITQLKQVEKTLRASEEKYRVTFESTGTAIVIIEEDAKLSLVNSEFEKLSGYSKEKLEGKKFWTEFVVNEDLERMREQHRLRRIDEKSASNRYEFRFKDSSGTIKNIL